MTDHDRFGKLVALDDWQLVNEEQDIRGYNVVSATGENYDKVTEMLVDKKEEHIAAVKLEDGRLVAVENLDIGKNTVTYRDDVAASRVAYTKVRPRA